jgi:hypothetical protein
MTVAARQHVFSANGAAFIASLGQAPQGSMRQETSALKVRFTETLFEARATRRHSQKQL